MASHVTSALKSSFDMERLASLLQPETSPYLKPQHQSPKRKHRKPASLAPIGDRHDKDYIKLHHDIAFRESVVVKAILCREDTLERASALISDVQSVPLDVPTMETLRLSCCRATIDVIFAIRDWREALDAASSPASRVFLWQGVLYIGKLALDAREIKHVLSLATQDDLPNPFFVTCSLTRLLGPTEDNDTILDSQLRLAATILFKDPEFIAIWTKATKSSAQHSNPLAKRPPHILDRVSVGHLDALLRNVPPKGFPLLRQALGILQINFDVDSRMVLYNLRAFKPTDLQPSHLNALSRFMLHHGAARPGRLYQHSATAAYLSLWLLQLLVHAHRSHQHPIMATKTPILSCRMLRFVHTRALVALSSSSMTGSNFVDITVTTACHVVRHRISLDDLQALDPSHVPQLSAISSALAPMIDGLLQFSTPENCTKLEESKSKLVSVVLSNQYGQMPTVPLASIDVWPTTTLAQARIILDAHHREACPPQFRFLYQGAHCPVSQEAVRCVLNATKLDHSLVVCALHKGSHRFTAFRAKAMSMLAHYLFIPISMALDEKRRREEQERLEASARMPRPKTSFSVHVQVDVPLVDLKTLRLPCDKSWTVGRIFNAMNDQHPSGIVIAEKTHWIYLGEILLEPTALLSSYNLETDDAILQFIHKRVDVVMDLFTEFHVQLGNPCIRLCRPTEVVIPFDHWALHPGDAIEIEEQTFWIVSQSIKSIELDRKFPNASRWYLRGQKVMRQLLYDPRLGWEVDMRLEAYLSRHKTRQKGHCFGKTWSVIAALQYLHDHPFLAHAHLRSITAEWFVEYLYDFICSTFPCSLAISPHKFSLFLKDYDLHQVLNIHTPEETHKLFDQFATEGGNALRKHHFHDALLSMAPKIHTAAFVHDDANLLENFEPHLILRRVCFGWFLSKANLEVQDGVFSYATERSLSDRIREECAALLFQATGRMYLRYQWYKRIRHKAIVIESKWRAVSTRRKYLVEKAARDQAAKEKRELEASSVLCMTWRRWMFERRVAVREAARRKIEQELAILRRDHRKIQASAVTHSNVRVVAILDRTTRGFVRFFVRLERLRHDNRASMQWLTAYNPSNSRIYLLALATETLATLEWTKTLEEFLPRLELHNDRLRLNMKEHATKPGRRLLRLVSPLHVATIPQRPKLPMTRFVVEAYGFPDKVIVDIYHPRNSRLWRFELPGGTSLAQIHELLETLRVMPQTSSADFDIQTVKELEMALKNHVVTEIQRHFRRRFARRCAVTLATQQWLRVQVKNKYQYVHMYSGVWRETKPSILEKAVPINPMREWIYVFNYSQIRVPKPYYIYPRKAFISLLSEEEAAIRLQVWLRKHLRREKIEVSMSNAISPPPPSERDGDL
ncbi:hypothetical protein Ae201684P_005535 [Aphanomyces euteiches]|uniref:Uncharacterized protein n=1 Tax=Aphanomyces euteiches TaxID=100861 RepID=A0A6G0X3Z4_9STRA|nr:hypothetical protein Ae201684_008777 [Aphanomyces euteiches]KAH9085835.1 hypothetical protein Ae201684P_005535 [Aphanomyces euteiches]